MVGPGLYCWQSAILLSLAVSARKCCSAVVMMAWVCRQRSSCFSPVAIYPGVQAGQPVFFSGAACGTIRDHVPVIMGRVEKENPDLDCRKQAAPFCMSQILPCQACFQHACQMVFLIFTSLVVGLGVHLTGCHKPGSTVHNGNRVELFTLAQ